ncbi:MAG: hypothetical protein H0V70_04405 [Ktedonobacteraceae bacterium]|nr:hypothetical protein [Ktedonobacteraceae bacterium]
MKSAQALQKELLTLHRLLQAHYTQIESHKSGVNLVAALFSSNVRRQSLQTVANARREIEYTIQQIQDVQEDQIAALFLECWEEELANLPSSVFLSTIE